MTRLILCVSMLILVSACGIKRPLIKPENIPAYEAEKKKKRAQLESDERRADEALGTVPQEKP